MTEPDQDVLDLQAFGRQLLDEQDRLCREVLGDRPPGTYVVVVKSQTSEPRSDA